MINYSNNVFDFASNCIIIDRDSNLIEINCGTEEQSGSILSASISYIGFESSTKLSETFSTSTSSFGFESKSVISREYRIPADLSFGFNTDTILSANPYNEFNREITASFGFEASQIIVFNPYNEFNREITASFGFNTDTILSANPYNEFNREITASFGFEASQIIVFNPYNQFYDDTILSLGYSVNADIRFADDPNISIDDIVCSLGLYSGASVSFGDNIALITNSFDVGYSANAAVQATCALASSLSIGFISDLSYLTIGYISAYFTAVVSSFGYEFSDNTQRPRYFDLSDTKCCTKKPYELLTIEMTDVDDWSITYGLDKGWGLSLISEISMEPRFSVTNGVGFSANVADYTLYINNVEAGLGFSAHCRSLSVASNIDLPYGNFITDQNEIKVELTKPLDFGDTYIPFYCGYFAYTNFGVAQSLSDSTHYFGHSSSAQLVVVDAWRATFAFGYECYSRLNNNVIFAPNINSVGFSMNTTVYEEPIYAYHGASMSCPGIITSNDVEFLENGEVINEYIFQDKNGDPDIGRPRYVSIEGYPYTHSIKGRCF